MRNKEIVNCPACSARPGELHQLGCDVERCSLCGQQLLSCPHFLIGSVKDPPYEERMPWTSEWPVVRECLEYGWFAKRNPAGPGYIPCAADDPEAGPDLNRLRKDAIWDSIQKRFVPKEDMTAPPRDSANQLVSKPNTKGE